MQGSALLRTATLSLCAICVVGVALAAGLRSAPAARAPARHAAEPSGCRTLGDRLCKDAGSGTSACRLAREELARASDAHCAGMLTRHADVLDELQALDDGVRRLSASEQRTVHGTAPSVGSPTAPLTLVEFCDFESPDCGRASPMANAIANLYGDRVRLVFRQYPSSKRPATRLAAEASLAAHAQGKFWEYHDVLFSNPQDASRAALERYAESIHLDMTAFRRALDAHVFAEDVTADVALGHQVQALDRPSLFANGKRVPVPYGADELGRLVGTALAK
jgi:hypothetical protein